MNCQNYKKQKGFVALISAVVISAVLLVLAAFFARGVFWARFAVLNRENKEMSLAFAEGCINLALLKIARNKDIAVPEQCEIVEISGANPYTIIARSDSGDSYTNLKVIASLENGNLAINDWREF